MRKLNLQKIISNPIAYRILKGSFWSLFGTAIGKFFILISGFICARILGDFQYGQLGIIRSTIAMFIVVGSAGIGVTASKFISEFRATSDNEQIISITNMTQLFALSFGLLIVSLVWIFAPFISAKILEAPELTIDIKFGAILLFFSIFNACQNGILSGFENFKAIGLNTLIAGFFECGFIIGGAQLYGVTGAITGYGISFIILTIINHISIRNTFKRAGIIKSNFIVHHRHIHILWKFSFPAALNSLLVTGSFWALRTMLVRADGFAQLGIYEAADQWKVIMLYIPSALSTILMPILSNVVGGGQSGYSIVKANLKANIIISLFFAIIVSVFSSFIMHLYGPGFEDNLPLILLSASTVFTTMALVTTTAMTSQNRVWLNFVFQILWASVMMVMAQIFLTLGFGASAIALAILISYFILAIIQTIYYFYYDNNH